MKRLLPILALLFWIGCDSGQTPDEPSLPSFNPDTHTLLEIQEKGFEMSVPIPKTITANYLPSANFNSATGVIEVDAGPGFQLEISEDVRDLGAIKASLAEDQLFTWNVQDETENGFVAQAQLPNGQSHYYQLFYQIHALGHSYLIRSREGANFNLKDVRTMRECVEGILLNT